LTRSRMLRVLHSFPTRRSSDLGAMIYLGDNWPQNYRNSILMGNIHGKRLNRDILQRTGSGYIARHAPDFMLSNDQWFRALDCQVDRKSTRLNSSHVKISYAVFC